MKSEAEIRHSIDVLRRAADAPCNCEDIGGETHKACEVGDLLMKGEALALEWVLGVMEGFTEEIERMERMLKLKEFIERGLANAVANSSEAAHRDINQGWDGGAK